MEKGLVNAAGAGASAAAEYDRARRGARPRRLFSRACAVAAAAQFLVAICRTQVGLAAGALVAALAAWLLRPDPDIDRWRRGAVGEVATAALLARLPRRYHVLHDRRIPRTRANIDHLIIGPTGVWVIDTKAYRRRLRIRRGAVWAGRHLVPTAPAAWEAERVGQLLGVDVAALVAVHGTGLRRRGKKVRCGVRIVPAQRVTRRVRHGRRLLTRAEILRLAEQADGALPPAARR